MCKVEREKAYDELSTYRDLTYQKPKEQQAGYREIDSLLQQTSAEGNLLRQIYAGYKHSYLSLGYTENDDWSPGIKAYLFQSPSFNGQLWSGVSFCA